MSAVMLAGLLKIELASHTVLLCDGGTVPWDGDTYTGNDSLFGSIAGMEAPDEGVGDEAPMVTLRFNPPGDVASADLIDAGHQSKRARLWIAEINYTTGEVVGTPEQQADMMIGVPRLRTGERTRVLEIDMVPRLERAFLTTEANTLSNAFHQSIYPGELGLTKTTGVSRAFAFGVTLAPRGVSGGSGGGGFSGGYGQYA